MEEEIYQKRMGLLKKLAKILLYISLSLALVYIVLLVCYNFAGVFTIQTLPGTKYENAFTYPGWQSIYYGVGEMIIQGYTEFSFNIFNCLGLFIPLIGLIVCSILLFKWRNKRGVNRKKAILEFASAFLLLFAAVMLFNCDKFAIMNAKNVTDSYQNYYTEYLLPALNGEVSFEKTIYPTLLLVFGLLFAVVKVLNGSLLIYQKKFSRKMTINTTSEVKHE